MARAFLGMASLDSGYRAAVIGASGAIGRAVVGLLEEDPRCAEAVRFSRSASSPRRRIDLEHEDSIAQAAAAVEDLDLLIIATGGLRLSRPEGGFFEPEKTIAKLEPAALSAQFTLNAIGPALVLKHFTPRFQKGRRGLIGVLSARVGSIGDNRLGGWLGYRAAKAALNQLVHTTAIELARTRPELVVAALHPGTVESPLSAPFRPQGAHLPGVFTPHESADRLLTVLDLLTPDLSGGFFDHAGAPIEW